MKYREHTAVVVYLYALRLYFKIASFTITNRLEIWYNTCYWVRHYKSGFRFKFSFELARTDLICASILLSGERIFERQFLFVQMTCCAFCHCLRTKLCLSQTKADIRTFELLFDVCTSAVVWTISTVYFLYLISIYIFYYINCSITIPKTWVVLRSLSIITEVKHITGFYYFSKCTEQCYGLRQVLIRVSKRSLFFAQPAYR